MAVNKPQSAWLSATGLLAVLLWTAQFAADWFLPHSDIGIAELDRIELVHVIHIESSDSNRAVRQESKQDPIAVTAAQFASAAIQADRSLITFAAGSAHCSLAVALPGIRGPPNYFLSA